MKTIIAGSRDFCDYTFAEQVGFKSLCVFYKVGEVMKKQISEFIKQADDFLVEHIGFLVVVIVIGLFILVGVVCISETKQCKKHFHYTSQECLKCVSSNGRGCTEFVESTCKVAVYDYGYAYCEHWID